MLSWRKFRSAGLQQSREGHFDRCPQDLRFGSSWVQGLRSSYPKPWGLPSQWAVRSPLVPFENASFWTSLLLIKSKAWSQFFLHSICSRWIFYMLLWMISDFCFSSVNHDCLHCLFSNASIILSNSHLIPPPCHCHLPPTSQMPSLCISSTSSLYAFAAGEQLHCYSVPGPSCSPLIPILRPARELLPRIALGSSPRLDIWEADLEVEVCM